MNTQLLIDFFVRQTMVLIAQVATQGGERAPLSQVANQVFLDLITELQRQGVGRKVIADMFGLALRSYQQKVQRLSESATDRGMTLWEAIHRYLQEKQVVSRAQILKRFCKDDDDSVKGIINDLVESGLASKTGHGDNAIYRITSAEDLARLEAVDPSHAVSSLAWVAVYRNGPISFEQLQQLVPLDTEKLKSELDKLVADGRVAVEHTGEASLYTSKQCFIPIGDSAGWEASLTDHYQAVVTAICAKIRNGNTRALPDDRIGGSTYSFDVWPDHPSEEKVYALLASFRKELSRLWDEVAEYNRSRRPPNRISKVTFYFGQNVTANEGDKDE